MATSMMDKSLYAAPQGLDESMEEGSIEIEIEDPEGVKIGIDGIEIDLMPEEETGEDFGANLAEYMDEGELSKLADDLLGEFEADMASRKDWVEMYVKGLEVLGMKYEERTEPWTGACGVFSTVLTEAAIRFQSETIIETFPAAGPVKTEIIGAIDKLKEDAAERVRDDMNYKLTEEMPEYRPEHERMLYNLGLAGAAFKKVYFDPSLGRQIAVFIPAEDLIIPYGASSSRTAERVTCVASSQSASARPSTQRSTSLPGPASPRARLPNSTTRVTPGNPMRRSAASTASVKRSARQASATRSAA